MPLESDDRRTLVRRTCPGHHAARDSFPHGHAVASDWRGALRGALIMADVPRGEANVGFLYVTDHFADDVRDIRDELRVRTGIETWIGTTGIGICATGAEYFDQPALALLVGSVPDDAVHLLDTGSDTPDEASARLAGALGTREGRFGIVHADPRNADLDALIRRSSRPRGRFSPGA